jgi:hypothetical protein
MKMFDVDNLEAAHYTLGPKKTKKNEEAQDVSNTSAKTTSISPEQGGYGGEIDGIEVEHKKGEVTLPRDKEDPSKKRKVPPLKPSSRKKLRAYMNKMQTNLTSYDFDFIVVALNDASLEITKKQEAQQEEI